MVLWAAGWSYLLLALFYLVIDVWQWRRWATLFTVIGSNAILAYMLCHPYNASNIVTAKYIAGLGKWLDSLGLLQRPLSPTLQAVASFALLWGLLYYLYRNKHFLRV